ncbi:MAG: LptF/LptG family permease [Fimbriimonadaceae bacterium]|nr:LptF/LptG family permease [Fimbriimonadaceae bacterium]
MTGVRKIDSLVFRELALPLLTGTLVIAMIFVANDAIAIFKNFNLESVPHLAVFQMLALRLPFWLGMTIPAGMAMASALAVSRLVRDSEVTALRAAGYPIRRLLVPILLAGLATSVVDHLVVDRLAPLSALRYRRLVNEVSLIAAAPRFQSNVTLQLDKYTCHFGTITRSDDRTVVLTDALLIEKPRPTEYMIYTAASGTYSGGVWKFQDSRGFWLKGERLQYVRPQELVINEKVRLADLFAAPAPDEETSAALRAALENARKTGGSVRDLETALHQKLAIPAACIVFAVASFWLSVRFARRGAFVGLFAGFAVLVLYFNSHVVSAEVLGRAGWVPPWLAAWLPVIVFGGLGLVLGRRLE